MTEEDVHKLYFANQPYEKQLMNYRNEHSQATYLKDYAEPLELFGKRS